jgi:hypothetical protein
VMGFTSFNPSYKRPNIASAQPGYDSLTIATEADDRLAS